MKIKRLQQTDFETGMAFERKLQETHAAFEAANGAYLLYMDILRQRYDAPPGEYTLNDWAVGFVKAETTNGE